jgi:hypothetical protein
MMLSGGRRCAKEETAFWQASIQGYVRLVEWNKQWSALSRILLATALPGGHNAFRRRFLFLPVRGEEAGSVAVAVVATAEVCSSGAVAKPPAERDGSPGSTFVPFSERRSVCALKR